MSFVLERLSLANVPDCGLSTRLVLSALVQVEFRRAPLGAFINTDQLFLNMS